MSGVCVCVCVSGGVCPRGCVPGGVFPGCVCVKRGVHLPPVDRILDTRL